MMPSRPLVANASWFVNNFSIALTMLLIFQASRAIVAVEGAVPSNSCAASKRVATKSSTRANRKSFKWKASLDCNTGVASSLEKSCVRIYSRSQTLPLLPSKNEVKFFAQEIFSKYPQFLGERTLTLGLCSVAPSKKNPHQCNLRSSIIPVDVLIFGSPRIVSSKSSKFETIGGGDGSEICEKIICCVEIPIVGGLLAHTSSKDDAINSDSEFGFLKFTWIQQSENKVDKLQQRQSDIILVTEIAGYYRPTLAGKNTPIPYWRKKLYCSTQRMFHAYVMWRYHGFVANEFTRSVLCQA